MLDRRRGGVLVALVVATALAVTGATQARRTDDPSRSQGRADTSLQDDFPGFLTVPAGQPSSSGADLTLAFAGDVHFQRSLSALARRPGATLGPMSKVLREADFAMVNLESALGSSGRPTRKELEAARDRYWFRSPPSALDVLARSGVDAVSLANNHGADYGRTGLRDTLRVAERSSVALVGVGRNHEAAFAPHRVTIQGTTVAVLAADASPRESAADTWAVRPGSGAGLAAARVADPPQLLAAVRAAAAVDDLVVVYLHWGAEDRATPTPLQRKLARSLSEAGADVLVGSHAHRLLGSGMRGDTYVSYGLGNFAWYNGRRSATGALVLRVRSGEVVEDQWSPARIPRSGGLPVPLVGGDRVDAIASWRSLRDSTNLVPTPGERTTRGLQPDRPPAYEGSVRPISTWLRERMRGASHRAQRCPVPLRRLRLLTMSYLGFDGTARTGRMVVHAAVAHDVVAVFRRLYDERWPIRRMSLVDAYGGDDERSMAADNTSAYNCRAVAGQSGWSDHAYGRAVDINPVENPYDTGDVVLPAAGREFALLDRSAGARAPRGVITTGDAVTGAFARIGWRWGGSWSAPDYQHFYAPR